MSFISISQINDFGVHYCIQKAFVQCELPFAHAGRFCHEILSRSKLMKYIS